MTTSEHTIRPRRTFIFAPGLKPEMYPKALASGTDIVCVELEDGIAPKDKNEARLNSKDFLNFQVSGVLLMFLEVFFTLKVSS